MKNLMVILAAASISTAAFAKTQTVSGDKAITALQTSFLGEQAMDGNLQNSKENHSCTAEAAADGTDLAVTMSVDDQPVQTIRISPTGRYAYKYKGETDGSYRMQIAGSDFSLDLTYADDAYMNVTATQNGQVIDCEMDM